MRAIPARPAASAIEPARSVPDPPSSPAEQSGRASLLAPGRFALSAVTILLVLLAPFDEAGVEAGEPPARESAGPATSSVPSAEGLTRRYYTPARIRAMAENLRQYEWARQQRDEIIARADKWLQYDDERLRTLVCPPDQPRAIRVHNQGAPVHGEELLSLGLYKWDISFDKPWTVTNPTDGRTYPSNDYQAFLESGREDRSLLTGPYPDDGWGCEVEGFEGRFWFVAYYAHWSQVRLLLPALADLSRAHLLTGDDRYAHACALLLWQLAEYYPDYAYEKQSRHGTTRDPDYLGRLLYHTWESLYTAQIVPPAWDAVREAVERDHALQELTGMDAGQIRSHVEDRLLATMARDITDGSGRIQGNFGMHQVALLRIARVLAERQAEPTPAQMLDWVLRNPRAANYTQLGLLDAMNNLLYRDGVPMENPSYNTHWVAEIAEMLAELPPETRRELLASDRCRNLFTWPIRLAVLGRFTPAHGDGGHLYHPLTGWTANLMEPAFRFYRDPMFAAAFSLKGGKPTRDVFQTYLGDDLARAAAEFTGSPDARSSILHACGTASLQTTEAPSRTALAMPWGYAWGHRHADYLHLDLYAATEGQGGYALCPDLGYPDTASNYDPRRFGWISHTTAHNTVLIDARRQETFRAGHMIRGRLWTWDPGEGVQVLDASAEDAYPGKAECYRRSLLLVPVTDEQAYVVDLFRVRGGSRHDWLLHGTDAKFATDLPLDEPRVEGTLAGPDVPYGQFYDDPELVDAEPGTKSYAGYRGSAFQWLFNVQSAEPSDRWHAASWTRNVTLRTHFPATGEDVFVCDGRPQRRKPFPDTLKFLVRRKTGEAGLASTFVAVHEPFWDEAFVRSVRTLESCEDRPGMGVALEVTHRAGRDVIVHRIADDGPVALDDGTAVDAAATVLRYRDPAADAENDRPAAPAVLYVLDGAVTRPDGRSVRAEPATTTVRAVDYDRRLVTLDAPALDTRPAGDMAIVSSRARAAAVPVAKIVSPTSFSSGNDDLLSATVSVQSARGRRATFLPGPIPHVEPGLHAVNERGEVVGRVVDCSSIDAETGWLDLDREIDPDAFPDLDGDGRRVARLAVIGPGDAVTLHRSRRASD